MWNANSIHPSFFSASVHRWAFSEFRCLMLDESTSWCQLLILYHRNAYNTSKELYATKGKTDLNKAFYPKTFVDVAKKLGRHGPPPISQKMIRRTKQDERAGYTC